MKEANYRDAAETCRMAAEEYRNLGLEDHARGAELCARLLIMKAGHSFSATAPRFVADAAEDAR